MSIQPARELQAIAMLRAKTDDLHLPSPVSNQSEEERLLKRKRDSGVLEEYNPQKRLRQLRSYNPPQAAEHDPIAYWVEHLAWPQEASIMSGRTSDSSSKRKSDSTHRAECLDRLARNGVFMTDSAFALKSSKDLSESFLQGSREPVSWPFPIQQLPAILQRIDGLNEARIQRDVLPWVVPSAENLFYNGELTEDWIGDEIHAEWNYCATMGSTRPKPDFTAGLLRKAFTEDEVETLQNYSSTARPFLFTPELSFPFLICEAKNGEEGLNKAHRQNTHSASIAVRAIIELQRAAFGLSAPQRVEELYGQFLVFTVSHNHNMSHLFGHYAVLEGSAEKLKFYRYEIALFSFTLGNGRDRLRTYNFVYNIYDKFAKDHRRRIKEAAAALRLPQTGLSFSTSELEVREDDSQSNSQSAPQEDETFQRPGEPASTLQRRQMNRIITQTQQTNERLQTQVSELLKQLEKMEEQRKEERKEMEEQRKEERKEMMNQLTALLQRQAG